MEFPASVTRLSKMGADGNPGPNDSQTQERVVWVQTAGLTGYRMSVNGGAYTWQVFGGKMEIGGFSLVCVRFLGKAFLAFGIRMRVFIFTQRVLNGMTKMPFYLNVGGSC